MAIGNNSGGQLNVLVFEVGMINRIPATGDEIVHTIAVHPMFVAPSDITYVDRTRSVVSETAGGALRTVSGRALLQCSLSGVWGVETRGFGPLIGSGELRFQRFWREIVRLGDALFREDIDEAIRSLLSSPLVAAQLRSFSEDTSTLFVNFYDFWNKISFQCQVSSKQWSRRAKGGGAVGLIHYRLQLQEVGPIVSGGVGDQIVSGLFRGLTLWADINLVLQSYNVSTLEDALVSIPGPVLSELANSLDAVNAQLRGVTSLMGANPSPEPGPGMTAFMATSIRLANAAIDTATIIGARATGNIAAEDGEISWATQQAEGVMEELELYDQQEELMDVEAAALWQLVAGTLFGMDRALYQEYVTASGSSGSPIPEISGTVDYTVTILDTEASITTMFGVDFDRILSVNAMTPDEALVPGTVLRIPVIRAPGPTPINGLPTFGSHLGLAALGVDMDVSFAADPVGSPALVIEGDCVAQGIEMLLAEFAADLIEQRNAMVPVVRTEYTETRLRGLLLSDKRVLEVEEIELVETGAVLDIDVALITINGGTVRTGRDS